jgi:hypothetical protein
MNIYINEIEYICFYSFVLDYYLQGKSKARNYSRTLGLSGVLTPQFGALSQSYCYSTRSRGGMQPERLTELDSLTLAYV